MQLQCPNCHNNIKGHFTFCPICGHNLTSNERNEFNRLFPSKSSTYKTYRRNKYIAGALGIFLGTFGFQRFYLGRAFDVTLGIVYLLIFSWNGFATLIGIVEGVYFLSLDKEQFDNTYNNFEFDNSCT